MEENVEQSLDMVTVIMEKGIELGLAYGPKLVLAFIVLIIGLWIIGKLLKVLDAALARSKVDDTLRKFLGNIVSVLAKFVLIVIFASMIGVETASLIAMLGAAGLAVGLALQGSLSNFAGGVLILLFKPFKVGDIIEAAGHLGRVHEIQVFNTILLSLDNQKIIIPNGILSNGCVKNLFCEETRRVDIEFGISYSDDLGKVKSILRGLIESDVRILKDPEAEVYISAHGDSAIGVLTRSWVKSEDYWAVYFSLYEEVKIAFDKEGISIPFPQRDVHLHQVTS